MKWLLITAYFPPEIGSASFLFYELGRELARQGEKVIVITGFPTYNVKPEDLPEKYLKGYCLKESIEGMDVIRVRTLGLPRYVPVARGIEQFITAFLFLLRGLSIRKADFERILVYSPPLPLGLTAYALSRIKGVPFVFNLQDIFPQSAIDLGVLKSSALINLFRGLERFIYKKANMVTCHSEGNRGHVVSCGGNARRVRVVPNWVNTDEIFPGSRRNGFSKKWDIEDKFVVSFAGVIGYSQDIDIVLDSVRYLKDCPDLWFVIVGDGVVKERLVKKALESGIRNVLFIPMQPKEIYPLILHSSDVCLATLKKEVKTPVVPSKILGIMAAGKPVVASLDLSGDAPKIIEEAKCGVCVEPENAKLFSEAILKFYNNRSLAEEYGNNGRMYAENNFSLKKCVEIYKDLIK